MGTNRLNGGQDERGTGPIKAKTGKLKPAPKVKPATGKLAREAAAPRRPAAGPKYTTAQLRLPPSRRRKSGHPVLKIAGLTAMILGVGAAAALAGAHSFLDSLGPNGKGFSLPAMAEGFRPMGEPQNILLLGADYSYADGQRMAGGPVRSDTMIVAGLDPAHHRLSLVSIPRDTRVVIRGHYDKINSALALGGPKLAAQVASNLLGVPIHHWAQVNTRGLERMVDVVGGVRLYVEKDMRYRDRTAGLHIDISRGWHLMDGERAHQFVRFRHDELGDIGRVRRQQQFLRAGAETMLKPDALLKVPQVLSTLKENIATSMTGAELMRIATWGMRLSREDVKMVMLPGEFSGNRYQASYWLPDERRVSELSRRYLSGQEATATPEGRDRLRITVLNGTYRAGLATKAADTLRAAGFQVYGVGDSPRRDLDKSQVIVQTGRDEWAPPLAEALGVPCDQVTASIGDVNSDFTLVVGEDFAAL